MKKLLLIPALLILIQCSPVDQYMGKSLYSVQSKQVDDIRGDYEVNEFYFYKDAGLTTSYYVSIYEVKNNPRINPYFVSLKYRGSDWIHINNMYIKTDGKVYELTDSDPEKIVISAGQVNEIMNIPIGEELLENMKNADNLELQYKGEHVALDAETKEKLQKFLKGNNNKSLR